jgi:hypothetical protein
MSKSTRSFNRWTTVMKSTWTFQVFNKYNDELNELLWANLTTTRKTFKYLKENEAKLTDRAFIHFEFDVPKGEEVFRNVDEWSKSYNNFLNWTNLNGILALTSNFETYLSTVVSLALESDPGVLFSSSKSIDGIVLLKNGAKRNHFHDDVITSLTKGEWNSRLAPFKKTFGGAPQELVKNIGELDKLRKLRNKVGHAFGRDIDGSRNHEVKDILKMEKMTDKKFKKFQHLILSTVRGIDKFLLENHIGEYQAIAFYHRIYVGLRKDLHQSERAIILKKQLGKFGDTSGKMFCKELVKYYEEL